VVKRVHPGCMPGLIGAVLDCQTGLPE
jgi:hypothetical protein